jgi:hypothetical protein
MEARTDRRASHAPRIPLDLLVQLSHEDFEEPFDADGVDVSASGLALRSDYLPEIGDRLRCRFDCPPTGSEIALDGEVVWAHDAGMRSGEFGMRFTDVDLAAESALRDMLAHFGAPTGVGSTVRLHLERVATPIEAEVVARSEGALEVEQELPFLKLGMSVAVEGLGPAHGRLASVDLRIEDGTPRLVLVVEHERVRAEPRDVQAIAEELGEQSEPDATLQDFVVPSELAAPREPAAQREPAARRELASMLEESDAEIEAAVRRDPTDEARAFAIEARDAITPGDLSAPDEEPRTVWNDLVDAARTRSKKLALSALAYARTGVERARPAIAAFFASALALTMKLLERGGPRVKRFAARVALLGQGIYARVAAKTKGKRRTTAAPVRVAGPPKRRLQREEQEAPSPKKMRRIAILSVLAFAGVGTAVYFFAGEDEPAHAAPRPAPIAAPAPAPMPPPVVAPAPVVAPLAADVAAPGAIDPLTGAPLAADAPQLAAPQPAGEAGQLGEPTYPSLREAAQRQAQAPAPQAASGTTFGDASVPNGRATTIRMDNPVTSLRGHREPDGFTVTIPGALALDRAGPMAQANPSIERATILNRGDHSLLTVNFVAGRHPPYRVIARGSAIEIIIGR